MNSFIIKTTELPVNSRWRVYGPVHNVSTVLQKKHQNQREQQGASVVWSTCSLKQLEKGWAALSSDTKTQAWQE